MKLARTSISMALVAVMLCCARPAAAAEPKLRPKGHKMVVAGVALVVGSLVAYVTMAVGLGLARGADAKLSLTSLSDERRRDLTKRRSTGRWLALGSGLGALGLMGAGIPLIVVGRRRALADTKAKQETQAVLGLRPIEGGAGVWARVRF